MKKVQMYYLMDKHHNNQENVTVYLMDKHPHKTREKQVLVSSAYILNEFNDIPLPTRKHVMFKLASHVLLYPATLHKCKDMRGDRRGHRVTQIETIETQRQYSIYCIL